MWLQLVSHVQAGAPVRQYPPYPTSCRATDRPRPLGRRRRDSLGGRALSALMSQVSHRRSFGIDGSFSIQKPTVVGQVRCFFQRSWPTIRNISTKSFTLSTNDETN